MYHNRSEDTDSKMAQILKDAALLMTVCGSRYDETSEYQLLIRVLNEQTVKDDNGTFSLKSSDSDMNSEILQNPADPDATYRKKAGKEHRGYIANVVKESNGTDSLTVDYQFEKNTYSDSQFVKDSIDRQSESEMTVTLTADGGYCGNENTKLAKGKNIELITTDLKGTDVLDLWADCEFSEDGTNLLRCAVATHLRAVFMIRTHKGAKFHFRLKSARSVLILKDVNPYSISGLQPLRWHSVLLFTQSNNVF